MKVYDFDDTIYDGDSSKDFLIFEIKRHPGIFALKSVSFLTSTILYILHIKKKETWKASMFSFLKDISDIQKEIDLFWDTHDKKIKSWYLKQQLQDDVIISASPAFLVEAGCCRFGITNVIATRMDVKTGEIVGNNCKGKEKVERFQKKYGNQVRVQEFYSDDESDCPMASMADRAFLVKGEEVFEWK